MPSDALGKRIRDIANSLNLNQAELASKARVAQAYLSKVISGRICPSRRILEGIARALGYSLRNLVIHTASEWILSEEPEWKGGMGYCDNKRCPEAFYRIVFSRDVQTLPQGKGRQYTPPRTLGLSYAKFPRFTEAGQENRFCPFCGRKLLFACLRCEQAFASEREKFCSGCGLKLFEGETDMGNPCEITPDKEIKEGPLDLLIRKFPELGAIIE